MNTLNTEDPWGRCLAHTNHGKRKSTGDPDAITLLLIDDQPKRAGQVKQILRAHGSGEDTIHEESGLSAALKHLGHHDADVVLLGLGLETGYGMETIAQVHQQSPRTPIIVLTTSREAHGVLALLHPGAQDYVLLDSNAEDLWRIIRHAVERKHLEAGWKDLAPNRDWAMWGSQDGFWDWNMETDRVFYSRQWKHILGYEDHEIGNQFDEWERRIHPEDRSPTLAAVQSYLAGESPRFEHQHRLLHKDGSYRWLVARGAALCNGAGKPYRMAGAHVELAGRVNKEVELQRANQALREINETLRAAQARLIQSEKMQSIGRLSAGIAHEVKNPLALIRMGVEYIRHSTPGPDVNLSTVLDEMTQAVQRADSIVRGLLDYAAPITLQTREEDLNQVVGEALRLVRHELESRRVTVIQKLQNGVSSLELDRGKICQVLVNLFMNALQAMAEGGVLTVRTHAFFPEDGQAGLADTPGAAGRRHRVVALDVEDTGPGIPEEDLPRVFDLFFTTKPAGVGCGLGLAIAKGIVELHGGGITLSNRPEGGAVASVRFLL